MSVLGHWFKRRLGIAIGAAAVGASLGGSIFPVAARHLIDRVGYVFLPMGIAWFSACHSFPWTMRVFGFILVFTLSVANLCLVRRLPPMPASGAFFQFTALKYYPFSAYCCAGVTVFLGAYAVPTFISASAKDAGLSEDFSFYLVTIINASACVGRLAVGLLIDRFGGFLSSAILCKRADSD
jgi:nitrate/nitrite transporter NarK